MGEGEGGGGREGEWDGVREGENNGEVPVSPKPQYIQTVFVKQYL